MSQVIIQSILIASAVSAGVSIHVQSFAEALPTVVVSAARTDQSTVTIPAGINIISQADIQASGATNVTEVLRNQGGIYLTDLYGAGTHTSIAMRGFSSEVAASNTLVIVDGRRLNNIDMSAQDLNSVSIKDIERIEIIQGSAGTLYGDQAVGGVINIITKSPTTTSKEIELTAGSYNRKSVTAKIEDKLSEKLSYRLSGKYLESDNYRDNNALDSFDVFGRVNYQLDGGLIFAEIHRVVEDIEYPGSLFQSEIDQDRQQSNVYNLGDYADSETDVARLGMRKSLSDNWLAELELTSRDQASDGLIWGGVFITNNKQVEFTPRLVGVYPVQHGELTVTLGADLLETDYVYESKSIYFPFKTEDEQKQQAYYVQVVWPFVERWSLTLGSRHAAVENDVVSSTKTGEVDDSETVVEYGVSYSPVENVRLFARIDENFRFAKVDELTYTSPGEELETQTGKSHELGIEFKQPEYSVRAVLYRLELKDEIAYDSLATKPVGGSFNGANVNFDPTTHDGLIVDAHYQLNQSLGLNGSVTYTKAEFDSGVYEGKTISGVPEKAFLLTADYRHNANWQYFAELAYTGRLYLPGDNDNLQGKQAGYSLMNANINYDRDAWRFSVRVNNLLNKNYSETAVAADGWSPVAYYPSPERNVWLSVAYRF